MLQLGFARFLLTSSMDVLCTASNQTTTRNLHSFERLNLLMYSHLVPDSSEEMFIVIFPRYKTDGKAANVLVPLTLTPLFFILLLFTYIRLLIWVAELFSWFRISAIIFSNKIK